MKRRVFTDEERASVLADYQAGKTCAEIASARNISQSTVNNWVRMNCDYCGQPGIQLVGETNGVVVCIDHAPKSRAREALRVIQKTADKQGNVTMLRLAENIANDAALVRLAQVEALHRAADDWPEDGLTRAEAQRWLTDRADSLGGGA